MKNQTNLISRTKNAIVGLLLMAMPGLALAERIPATATSVKGDATVVDETGHVSKISVGDKLPVGDTVVTGKDGVVGLTLVPGAGTVVQPNTKVKIATLDFYKGADGSNNRTILLNLQNGDLISSLYKKDGHSDFKVATAYGVAAAKGTVWQVVVNGTTLTINVVNGTVIDVAVTANGTTTATATSISAGQSFDSTTGTVGTLSSGALSAITSVINTALPGFSANNGGGAAAAQAIQDALNGGATVVNPANVSSSTFLNAETNSTNSPASP